MNTKSITEGALIAVLSIILSLITYYIPLFSGFTYFLLPIPTIVMYKRHGLIPAFLSGLTATLLLLLLMDPINTVLYGSLILIPGLALGYSYQKNLSGAQRIIYGFFGFLVAIIIEIAVVQFISGVSFVNEISDEITMAVDQVKQIYTEAGLFEGDQGDQMLNTVNSMVETLKMLLPTVILLIPLVFSYCTVLFNDLFFRYIKIKYKPVKPITEWEFSSFNKNCLAIFTVITLVFSLFARDTNFEIYAFTLENIVTLVFVLMGLSFIFWYFQFKFKKKLILVRILVLLLCFMVNIFLSLVMIIGVFNVFFDLKKFFQRRKEG